MSVFYVLHDRDDVRQPRALIVENRFVNYRVNSNRYSVHSIVLYFFQAMGKKVVG